MSSICSSCTQETCVCFPWQARIADEMARYGETLDDLEAVGWQNGEWAVWTQKRVYYPDRDISQSEPCG